MDDYRNWVGRTEENSALVKAYQADALAATLDHDDPPYREGDAIPPGWHQFFIREVVKLGDTASALGEHSEKIRREFA